jgi:hypothetical protein
MTIIKFQIPSRFRATCEFCGNELDTRQDDVYRCTAGWVEAGGDSFSQITERFNRWAHQHCVERKIHQVE